MRISLKTCLFLTLLLVTCVACGPDPGRRNPAGGALRPETAGPSAGLPINSTDTFGTARQTPNAVADALDVPAAALDRLGPPRPLSFNQEQGFKSGSQYEAALSADEVTASGSAANFAPATGGNGQGLAGLAFAVYRFVLPQPGPGLLCSLDWETAPESGRLYLGYGNFTLQRWDWYEAPPSDAFTLSSAGSYFDGNDQLLLAVVVQGGANARLASIQLNGVNAPIAILKADKSTGLLPLSVNFDGSESFDPDGSLVDYEWDFDGDGLYSEPGPEAIARGSAAAGPVSYNLPGWFEAALRVTDNESAQSTALLQIGANLAPEVELDADLSSGDSPLTVSFTAQASDTGGSIVQIEWDFDGDTLFGGSAEEQAAADDATPSQVVYLLSGEILAQVRVSDDMGATAEAQLLISVTNPPPIADLQCDIVEGEAPLSVQFDGTGSADGGAELADFEWDFDGDNAFNEAGPEALARGLAVPQTQLYAEPGLYYAKLQVTDAEGATGLAVQTITVHGWKLVPIEDSATADVGTHGDIALVNGTPAVVYRDETANTLKFAHSINTDGPNSSDWKIITIPTPGITEPGYYASINEINGNAAIASRDNDMQALIYLRASSVFGTSPADWIAPVHVQDADDCGTNCQLLQVDGCPAIIYDNNSTGELFYAHSSTQEGDSESEWSVRIAIDGLAGQVSSNGSLALVYGNPAFASYHNNGNGTELLYGRAASERGDNVSDWSAKTTLAFAPAECWLRMVSGRPAVLARDSSGLMAYFRAADSLGDSWNPAVLINLPGGGTECSFAVIGGKPALACHLSSPGDLVYLRSGSADGAAGTDWQDYELVSDSASDAGSSAVLIQLSDGKPAIFYRDDTAKAAMYAVRL